MINVDINTYGIDISLGKVIIRSVSYSEYEVLNSLGDLLFSGRIESGQTASIVAPDAYYYLRNSNSDFVLSGQVPSETTEYISLSDSYYVLFNSDEDFVASGSTLYGQTSLIVAPDANYTLVNSSGNTLSSSTIASSGSTTIIAPDAQYTINYESGTFVQSGNTASGEIKNITIQDFPTDEWTRPSNWLPRPIIATGEKVIYLLCRVDAFGNNWIGFTVKGNYTVDWGYGATEDFNSGVTATKNLDYAQLTEWWDSTHTDKQCWVKITPQAGQYFNYFITPSINYSNYDDFGRKYNIGVIECLIGKLDTLSYGSGIRFNNLINIQCIKIYERIISNVSIDNLFYLCYNLICIEGELETQDAQYIFNECYNLTYTKDFQIIGSGGNFIIVNETTSVPILNWPEFIVKYYNGIGNGMQLKSVTYKKVQYCYGMAYCFKLEEFILTDDDGSYCLSFYNAFVHCNFKETPVLNLINSGNNTNMFQYNWRLVKSNLSNIKASISFYGCNLSHAAILEIFDEQLLTVVSAQTIDLRLNPDIANLPAATIAIATAKNWTVIIA